MLIELNKAMTSPCFVRRLSFMIVFFSFLIFPLPVHSFSRSFFLSRTVSTTTGPAIPDELIDSLTRALPKTIDPAFTSAVALLRFLETKPSCHRLATAALVNDCNSLDSMDNDIKVQFAARLAVCEFESTGVSYPRECRRLEYGATSDTGLLKCVQRLEEKPQWWTSLSNSIQNVVVICAAVKHEIEKDDLLHLHKNITKIQESLYNAMHTSVDQSWSSIEEQKRLSENWTQVVMKMKSYLRQLAEGLADSLQKLSREILEIRGQNAMVLGDIHNLVNASGSGIEHLADKAKIAWTTFEHAAMESTKQQKRELELNKNLMRKSQIEFVATVAGAAEDFIQILSSLSSKIQVSVDAVEDSLSTSHTELLRAQESLAQIFARQGVTQTHLVQSLEAIEPRLNATFETMILMSRRLSESLAEAEYRVNHLNSTGQSWPSIGVFVLGIFMLSEKRMGKLLGGILLALCTGTMFWTTTPLLRSFFHHAQQGTLEIVNQTTITAVESLHSVTMGHQRNVLIYIAGSFVIIFLLCGVVFVYGRNSSSTRDVIEKGLE